jgi:hypothetical protein
MLDLIVAKNSISSQFWDLPSCFYRRNLEVEEVFCVPYSETREGPITGTTAIHDDKQAEP